MSDPFGYHAGQFQNNYTEAENRNFTQQFGAITLRFKAAMDAGLQPESDEVQACVAEHYAFCLQFWKPNRESYRSLALSYLMPSPYRDAYENVAEGLAKYHYDAIVAWADTNL